MEIYFSIRRNRIPKAGVRVRLKVKKKKKKCRSGISTILPISINIIIHTSLFSIFFFSSFFQIKFTTKTAIYFPPGRNGSYYELLLGQHQEVHLNISVHNFKEAAYEAQLFIAHHPRLSYISLQEAKGVICNPYNASLVACTLGNPFKTGAGAHFKVRWDLGDKIIKVGHVR